MNLIKEISNLSYLVLPFLFIVLYGSGFVATKYGLINSTPLAFLFIRFCIACILLTTISFLFKVSFPKTIKEVVHIAIAGCLTVATFSIGVYISINLGVSPSLNALIIALQPTIVAIIASLFLKEIISFRHWLGLFIGFIGVAFVIVSQGNLDSTHIFGIIMSICALLGLSFGNVYQKKYCSSMNLFSGGAIQTFCCAVLVFILMLVFEEPKVNINMDLVYALFYMAVVVSIISLSLLYIMIRNGEVSKVSSMFYLMPVCAVITSYIFFDEAIKLNVMIGIVAVFIGIILINKK